MQEIAFARSSLKNERKMGDECDHERYASFITALKRKCTLLYFRTAPLRYLVCELTMSLERTMNWIVNKENGRKILSRDSEVLSTIPHLNGFTVLS